MPLTTTGKTIGKPFTELPEVDSTNNYAMAAAQKMAASHGHAWFAHRQTAGKGSRGKIWKSSDNENIILSALLQPAPLLFSDAFYLNACIALATYDFFKHYAGDETSIKWSNDIYWRDRKAAGILVENSFRGSTWQWSVAGVGVNINQTHFDSALTNPVSLKQITGKTYSAVELAKELCNCMQQRHEQLTNKESILQQYNAALYKKGETVKLKKDTAVFSCTIKGVNGQGQLQVENGPQETFEFGEVVWVV